MTNDTEKRLLDLVKQCAMKLADIQGIGDTEPRSTAWLRAQLCQAIKDYDPKYFGLKS